MKKRIMVLGAGRGQVDLIKAIKNYGHTVIVASVDGNYPGFEYADEICYVDISNPVDVYNKAKELNLDAVTTACLDTGIAALGYTCEKLNLSGLSENSAKLSGDKLLMKSAFMNNGVNTARFKKVTTTDDLSLVDNEFNYPMIVKAVDLQGSRGINIVHNKDELLIGFNDTMNETRKDFCIVEEFIEGYEFGAQAFVVNNKVLYVLPCGDITFLGKTNIPVGHYAPFECDNEMWESIYSESVKAINAIGLNNCAVNIDMILKDGKVYMIELTGRVGANCLPQLTSIYYGIDVYKLIIDTALGLDPSEYFFSTKKAPTACYAKMLYSLESGVLKEFIDNNESNESIIEITPFVKTGSVINEFSNSKDCIGQIVVKGENIKECKKLISIIESNIRFVLK